jgi:hypothetical protein
MQLILDESYKLRLCRDKCNLEPSSPLTRRMKYALSVIEIQMEPRTRVYPLPGLAERILTKQSYSSGYTRYLVKWQGYAEEYPADPGLRVLLVDG